MLYHIHTGPIWGGKKKYPALRLDELSDIVYKASNNELVHTKTLIRNCTVLITAHSIMKGAKLTPKEEEILNKKESKKIQKKYNERKKNAKINSFLEVQFLCALFEDQASVVWLSRWLCARGQEARVLFDESRSRKQ
ncbi:unnamed protein product [Nyctereutes procyonoides]|uniref:(raccoon dog) hypothetical protein n=1 Tax=Nyctereutes procyonoides TaxID=34880 RepID=A0A811Y5D4_NYCPR|nr:unnamed protein product [Nyctereutes procyonoides]